MTLSRPTITTLAAQRHASHNGHSSNSGGGRKLVFQRLEVGRSLKLHSSRHADESSRDLDTANAAAAIDNTTIPTTARV